MTIPVGQPEAGSQLCRRRWVGPCLEAIVEGRRAERLAIRKLSMTTTGEKTGGNSS